MRPNISLISLVADALRSELGDDFDQETFLDTLDGETDALDLTDALLASMQDDEALSAATKAQADELAARAKRIGDRAKSKRRALLSVLDAMGEKKLERPRGTITRRSGGVSLVITDEAAIPSQLTKTRVEPDKAAIKAQLQAGETVPGAELARGDDTLSIRVK